MQYVLNNEPLSDGERKTHEDDIQLLHEVMLMYDHSNMGIIEFLNENGDWEATDE